MEGELTADFLRPVVYDLYPKLNPPPDKPTEKESDAWETDMENTLKRVRRELADEDDGIARITGSYKRCVDGKWITYKVIVSFYSKAKHFKTAFAENDILFYAGHANGNSGNILQAADGESIDVSKIPGKDLANKPVILMRCSSSNMADTLTAGGAFAFGSETENGSIPISPGAMVTGIGAALDGKKYGEIVKGMNDKIGQESAQSRRGTLHARHLGTGSVCEVTGSGTRARVDGRHVRPQRMQFRPRRVLPASVWHSRPCDRTGAQPVRGCAGSWPRC